MRNSKIVKVGDFFAYDDDTQTFENSDIFDNVLADLREWTSISDLTVNDIAAYFWERYFHLQIFNYPKRFLTAQVTIWHNVNRYYFVGLYNTTQLEYNPIYNVDETTNETNTRTPNLSKAKTGTETNADTRSTTSSDSITGINQVTTYDSNTFNDDSKNTQTGSNTTTNSGNITTTYNTTDTETGTDKNVLSRTRSGNIGVTSSQDLIEQERNIRDLSIFTIWCDRFADRFLIPIYENERKF